MAETSATIKKRVELSARCAERLSRLVREHHMSEDMVIESALNVLFSLIEDLDPQAEQRGWFILPDKVLPQSWRDAANEEVPKIIGRHSMSYDEFLDWADTDILTEWVDGEVMIATPSSDKEQIVREFLHNVLRIFVSVNKQGLIRASNFQMKLERSGREPDLFFVSTENVDRLKKTYLDGPADMVVEISSPEHIGRDRGEKFYEYEQAGIPEYWLIDPVRLWAEFYHLGEHGRYLPVTNGEAGVFQSYMIRGFWLRIEWLWQPPPILQALRELGIISPDG